MNTGDAYLECQACGMKRATTVEKCPCDKELPREVIDKVVTAPKNNIEEGKPRMSLLPLDLLSKYLVPAYEEGVKKYNRESWRDGFHTSIMIDSVLRHIEAFFWYGDDIDPESTTGKHHLAGAIFSLLSILHTLEAHPELDDRRGKIKPKMNRKQ